MNVTSDRNIDKVVVLGSGMSILDLNKKEIEYINRCKIVIAVNKFMAFYKKSGIIPTHIYFHDLYGAEIFNHIVKTCKDDNLSSLTLFTSSFYDMTLYNNILQIPIKILQDIFQFRIKSLLVILLRRGNNCDIHYFKLLRRFKYIKSPNKMKTQVVSITKWNKGGEWAKKLSQKIFHYRGSLSSVLNIASIISPGSEIILVGNDFNCESYFYENELNELNIKWKDYTYDSVKKTKTHFSFQNINGTKIEDKFPFIIEKLEENGNNIFCNNKNSLLVLNAGVKYKEIIE